MLYAVSPDGQHWPAAPGRQGRCPACTSALCAKCGAINIWHWAHRQANACDAWYEPETAWHLAWKAHFPAAWVEVPICKAGVRHIADVQRPDGLVISFQHSPISPAEIAEREAFYGPMVWIFDIRGQADPGPPVWYGPGPSDFYHAVPRFDIRHREDGAYTTFRWRQPRKHVGYTTRDTYLDIADYLYHLKKMHVDDGPPYGGWGYVIHEGEMIDRLTQIGTSTQEANQ